MAGCFEIEQPIISNDNAASLPGGPGFFTSIDPEDGVKKTLEIVPSPANDGSYSLIGKSDDGDITANITLMHVSGSRYVLETTSKQEQSRMVFAADISPELIRLANIDSDELVEILGKAGIPVVEKVAFGDNSDKDAQIARLRADGKTFAVKFFGLKVIGEPSKTLELAKEMATSVDFSTDTPLIELKRQ